MIPKTVYFPKPVFVPMLLHYSSESYLIFYVASDTYWVPLLFLFPSSGNYGNILDSVAQPSISSSTSPAMPRRRRGLDLPDSSDIFGSSCSPPLSPSSPLLSPPDTTLTSKSTTPPEKPVIVEGNRLSHIVIKFLMLC